MNKVDELQALKKALIEKVSEGINEAFDIGADVSNDADFNDDYEEHVSKDICEACDDCIKRNPDDDIDEHDYHIGIEVGWHLARKLFLDPNFVLGLGYKTPRQALLSCDIDDILDAYSFYEETEESCDEDCDCNIEIDEKQINDIANSLAHVIMGAISKIR